MADDWHTDHAQPPEHAYRARAMACLEALVQRGLVSVQSAVAARDVFGKAWDDDADPHTPEGRE